MKLDGLSISELEKLEQEIVFAKQKAEHKRIEDARNQIYGLMDKLSVTVDDLFPSRSKRRTKTDVSIPMYQSPDDPKKTWSGHGRRPRWFLDKVSSGVDPQSMLIPK